MGLLPEIDIEFLDEKGFTYHLDQYPGGMYLTIKEFDFPENYSPRKASLLINVITGYPGSALDMFWTTPDVKLLNGSMPTASSHKETHNGQIWQRWSRHTAWRLGIDNIQTFITSIKKELAKGI